MLARPRRLHWARATALLLWVGLSLSSCKPPGSGTPATEVREVAPFDRILANGIFRLVVHVSPNTPQRLEITVDDDLLHRVETEVSGGQLELSFDSFLNPFHVDPMVRVEAWVPSLTQIHGNMMTISRVDGLHGDLFELLHHSGVADAALSGAVDRFEARMSGSYRINAEDLEAKHVVLRLSITGKAEVWANQQLDVELSGEGEVGYRGNPASVNQRLSDKGVLEARD